jgi:hypothetical protein
MFKAFGNAIPLVSSGSTDWIIKSDSKSSTSYGEVWYDNHPWREPAYAQHRDNGNFDEYGVLRNNLGYRPRPDNFTSNFTGDIDVMFLHRPMPGPFNETSGYFKMKPDGRIEFNGNFSSTGEYEFLKLALIRFKKVGSNWWLYKNGLQIGSGTGYNINFPTLWLGANGHPMEHQFFYKIYKLNGTFSDEIAAEITADSHAIWGLDTYPNYPYYENIHLLSSQQWDYTNYLWDLKQNKTVVFAGGNGIEGNTETWWNYWNGSDGTAFPIGNKIEEHKFYDASLWSGSKDGQGFVLTRKHFEDGNGRGNPTIYTNPGIAGNIWNFANVWPRDSDGLFGEPIVTQFIQDNIG